MRRTLVVLAFAGAALAFALLVVPGTFPGTTDGWRRVAASVGSEILIRRALPWPPMEASYDPEADAAYVRIRRHLGPTLTDVAEDGTVIDRDDETGDVNGYELLEVSVRGLDAFQAVPEAGRKLVFTAMEAARVTHKHTRVSDTGSGGGPSTEN